jgi:hypothetical protein
MKLVVSGLLLGSLLLSPQQASNNLVMVIGGGYSLAISTNGYEFSLGKLKKPGGFEPEFKHHPLNVALTHGAIHSETTIPPETLKHESASHLGWKLTGASIEVLDGDAPFPQEKVKVPDYTKVDCNPDEQQVNNRYFLPDLMRITQQKEYAESLPGLHEGRLVTHGGELKVVKLAIGCFEFRKKNQPVETKRLAHGIEGVQWSHAFTKDRIKLKVTRRDNTVGYIVLLPDNGKVQLNIHTHEMGTTSPNKPIKHFKYFYKLLKRDVPSDEQQIPTWVLNKARGEIEAARKTPGEACPPGFYFPE